MHNFPVLSTLIVLPLLAALSILIFVRAGRNNTSAKYAAVLGSLMPFLMVLYIYMRFDEGSHFYQFVENYPLLTSLGLEIHLGIDGISLFFLALTALLTPVCIGLSMQSIDKNVKEFLVCILLLESLTFGVFCTLNLVLFYIFFESILIPMYLIIGIWGNKNRLHASVKFFIYTLASSILFLVVIIFLFKEFGTTNIASLVYLTPTLPHDVAKYMWIATFIVFAVKIPIFPVHTWLPDAYGDAPTAGSIMLSGVLQKIGGYAFLRILFPMFPDISAEYSSVVLFLSAFIVVYASLIAMAQTCMKRVIAYSSIAHMGYATAGIFSLSDVGMDAALLQLISHGVISAALFGAAGILYERVHTDEISDYGGVAQKMPVLATMLMIATMGAVGLPGTSGFIGEFLSIISVIGTAPGIGAILAFGVILGAIYMLRMYRDVMFGAIKNDAIATIKDLSAREIVCILPMIICILYMGVMPGSISKHYANSLRKLSEVFVTKGM